MTICLANKLLVGIPFKGVAQDENFWYGSLFVQYNTNIGGEATRASADEALEEE